MLDAPDAERLSQALLAHYEQGFALYEQALAAGWLKSRRVCFCRVFRFITFGG